MNPYQDHKPIGSAPLPIQVAYSKSVTVAVQREHLEGHPGYWAAVALQKTIREMDAAIEKNRRQIKLCRST